MGLKYEGKFLLHVLHSLLEGSFRELGELTDYHEEVRNLVTQNLGNGSLLYRGLPSPLNDIMLIW